jgi:predicted ATPase
MNNMFVIEGQSGAGKTPLINQMLMTLNKYGFKSLSVAPFTKANQYIVDNDMTDLYPLGIYNCWSESIQTAVFAEDLISFYIETALNEIKDNEKGILILDRGWLTVCMGLIESKYENSEKSKLISKWINQNIPTFFLDTKQEITQSRQSWNPIMPWTNENIDSDFSLRRNYIDNYPNLLGRYTVLENRIDLNELSEKWVSSIINYQISHKSEIKTNYKA